MKVEGLNATLGDIGSLLQEALDIASDAGRQANQALDNVELVDNIIQQILVSYKFTNGCGFWTNRVAPLQLHKSHKCMNALPVSHGLRELLNYTYFDRTFSLRRVLSILRYKRYLQVQLCSLILLRISSRWQMFHCRYVSCS